MPTLIDSVARMTHNRDRDVLEATMVEVLADVIRPLSIRLYNLVPIVDRIRVHCRVETDAAGAIVLNPLPRRAGVLPIIEDFPYVFGRLNGTPAGSIQIEALGPDRCWVPISNGRDSFGWIEIDHSSPLTDEHRRLITGLLRVY